MRLKSFRIKNYQSITDSKEINLSDLDNVMVLAGQNESGKSSILRALRDYEEGEFSVDSIPFAKTGKPVQSVDCTYAIDENDGFAKQIAEELVKDFKINKDINLDELFDFSKLESINTFKITKEVNNDEILTDIDDRTFTLIQRSLNEEKLKPLTAPNPVNNPLEEQTTTVDEVITETNADRFFNVSNRNKIAETVFTLTPRIVFFDDFCDLLPDKILLTKLEEKSTETKGYQAVKNLERKLGIDFTQRNTELDGIRESNEEVDNKTLSIDFQKDWGQRIHGENKVNIEYSFQKRDGTGEQGSYINFYVITKEHVKLEPKKRSKGLIWFLSLWLELNALEKSNQGLIILLDEPDQHLHVKAQANILDLINKLSSINQENLNKKPDQIIYATHSPYLIESNKLNRIRLVVNDEKLGTTIEDISHINIDSENKRDALQPIADAMGLSTSDFSILNNKNVIVEGVSDFFYLTAMKKLLNRGGDYKFVPGIGVRQINNLISFCIGYGLDWLTIIDDDPKVGGTDSKNKFNEINDYLFDGSVKETKRKVHIMENIVGIENMFKYEDLKLLGIFLQKKKDLVKSVGKDRKIMFGRKFFEKSESGEITKENLSEKSIENFTKVFDFIQEGFEL